MSKTKLIQDFQSIDIKWACSDKILQIIPSILLRAFQNLDDIFNVSSDQSVELAVLVDDGYNSAIIILYCWFKGHKFIAIDRNEIEAIQKYKLGLFPGSNVVIPADLDLLNEKGQHVALNHCNFNSDLSADFLVTFTSGSTGQPKAVVHSRSNIINCVSAFNQLLPSSVENRKFLFCFP